MTLTTEIKPSGELRLSGLARYFYQFCRYAVGILFIISGLIKLNDPVGTQIKLEEYFEVFSASIAPVFHYLVPLALPLAFILCIAEVMLGIALLIRYQMKITAWLLLIIIVFFTFLTFYSAWFNKVTDCGCFGDAIKLTPWQSFTKDIVLLVLIGYLFIIRKRVDPVMSESVGQRYVALSFAACIGLGMYAVMHLPPIDMRAYKVGANIPAAMTLPPGAKPTIYQTVLTLKNSQSGEVKSMSDTEYNDSGIWQDSTWVFQSSESKLVQEGDRPKITDYSVKTSDGADITQETFQGKKLFLIVRKAPSADVESISKVQKLAKDLEGSSIQMAILTNDAENIEAWRHEYQLALPVYYVDGTVLKTIMRSDPGLWMLKEGTVVGKWHFNDYPSTEEVKALAQ